MTEQPRIAGHLFTRDPLGRERCSCGAWWHDVAGATRDDIGTDGWAHVGALLEAEYEQIATERDRRWDAGLGRVAADA